MPLLIEGYRGAGFRIAGQLYAAGIILADDIVYPWPVQQLAGVCAADFAMIREALPPFDVLLIGTGATMQPLPAALRHDLKAMRIAADAMDSRAAARTYNLLVSEQRRVAVALLPLA